MTKPDANRVGGTSIFAIWSLQGLENTSKPKAHKLFENHPCACVNCFWAQRATSHNKLFSWIAQEGPCVPVQAGQEEEGSFPTNDGLFCLVGEII